MRSGFDINKIRGEGYLILPLSMSRLATSQSPEFCYQVLEEFLGKLETFSNDVVLLYTNGLYFNSEEISFENRKKTTQQSLNHIYAFRNLVQKKRQFMPGAVHYLPIDYIIFNSPFFKNFFERLKKLETQDEHFKNALISDAKAQKDTEANMNFLIEEIVVNHLLREGFAELPKTLVKTDVWRLIAYPGNPLQADIYQLRNNILPKGESKNPYRLAHYNLNEGVLAVFSESEDANLARLGNI